ncbi:Dabb family protein [Sediminicola sp. 1XM1-17]|uniref:Dabb family protein n=1 Tax=Sediminicola sp. 1XM1-17 TaxID=3127702 RepID=UPI0030789D6A
MKIIFSITIAIIIGIILSFTSPDINTTPLEYNHQKSQDRVLRHVVLFKFKEGTSPMEVATIEAAFNTLPSKIKAIHTFEWGLNNSPEGLNKGFTHCYFLTFKTEEDRDVYLPHPEHKAFGALLTPHLEDVLVVDYWAQ